MTTPKVTIGVLLYKDEKYLAHSLSSLLDQDYESIEYIFRDQSPNGEVYDYLLHAHPEFFHKAKIKRAKNLMHCGGHNAIIREMMKNGSEYYICASNDMLYPSDFVSHIIRGMEGSEPRHYVATSKLMQWDYKKMLTGDIEGSKTGIVDSYGIGITKGHHFYDIGQGKDEKDVEIPTKMLGPSGALAVYHKDALEAIAYKTDKGKTEYFDENMHYKGDVDLAYRLSWAGFPCYLAKDVKVYHDRQVGEKGKGHLAKLKAHHQKDLWAKADSLKGHLITLEKNFDKRFSFSVKFRTFLNNFMRGLYTALLAPGMLKVYTEVRKLKEEIEKRKRAIQKNVSPTEIES
ncbi:glycosyltransferase, partial [Patescibacteria group bacterium]|nr:glycosyltransferase [Patescibacteria group bacterium]MBU1016286.1 glycosyltransferase [Patescibacteria group bacterium]MBU1685562.1 glycosyltransferase [Patescibacteria group bacterium]MBU1938487.1 glycosyltransferase [Patescibacteria group bacterium]